MHMRNEVVLECLLMAVRQNSTDCRAGLCAVLGLHG